MTDDPKDYPRRHARTSDAPCLAVAYQRAACMLPWGHSGPHDHGPPTEETKPIARAHLKGCVLDSDHKEGCYVELPAARPCPHGNVGCGTTRICEVCKGARRPNLSPFRQDSDDLKSPALSPRQALGEALACVERARDLLRGVVSGAQYSEASHAAFMGLASVNDAWAQVTSARALIAQSEKT